MSNKPVQGFTLVEMILAIVIISVALVGTMAAFTQSVRGSADAAVRKQMQSAAEELMEEVQLKPFVASAPAGPVAGSCVRNTFNDIFDYNAYSASNICDVDGTVVVPGYTVNITVVKTAFNGIAATDAALITITISKGGDQIQLLGWRINYA